MRHVWDYEIKEGWKPQTEEGWLWYLERRINYDDWKGLKKEWILEYWPKLKERLDPAKRFMLELYFEKP